MWRPVSKCVSLLFARGQNYGAEQVIRWALSRAFLVLFCFQSSSIRRLTTPWTYFLHLSLSSAILIDSFTVSSVHVLMLSIQAVRGLPRLRAPGIVPCVHLFLQATPNCLLVVWRMCIHKSRLVWVWPMQSRLACTEWTDISTHTHTHTLTTFDGYLCLCGDWLQRASVIRSAQSVGRVTSPAVSAHARRASPVSPVTGARRGTTRVDLPSSRASVSQLRYFEFTQAVADASVRWSQCVSVCHHHHKIL